MGDLQLENQTRETVPRVVYVREPQGGSDSSDAEISSSEEEEARFLITEGGPNVPAEYWQIQKLIKYIKAGDQTATNISLSILKDHDLTLEINQIAIKDVGGLEVLVNILETEEHRCRVTFKLNLPRCVNYCQFLMILIPSGLRRLMIFY